MRYIYFLWSLLFAFTSQAQVVEPVKKFILSGKIIGQDSGIIILGYFNANSQVIQDTCLLNKGLFTFTGVVNEPTLAFLIGNVKSKTIDDPNRTELFLEPSTMEISVQYDNFKHAKITGSYTQGEMDSLKKQRDSVYTSLGVNTLQAIYMDLVYKSAKQKENVDLQIQTKAAYNNLAPYRESLRRLDFNFIAGHSKSFLSPYLLRFHFPRISADSLQMFYDSFSSIVQNSFSGKMVKEQILKKNGVAVGSSAFIFKTKDISGQIVDLSSFKGKNYVLLDFWASWCIPCRRGNPRLIELYKKYHEKGLEIISISSDTKEADWKKAVSNDHTDIWHHVLSDLTDKKANVVTERNKDLDIAYKYGVALLPTKILLNKNAKIISRNESDDDTLLSQQLKEIFGF